MALMTEEGPGSQSVSFCIAASLAALVLDESAMELVRERDECTSMFRGCLNVLSAALETVSETREGVEVRQI